MMHVLIPGGTGLIGTALTQWLIQHDHTVTILSRSPRSAPQAGVDIAGWDGQTAAGLAACIEQADAVVNLAGANLGDQRWNEAYKQEIRSSRTVTAHALAEAIETADKKPATFVQASAVGYYGSGYRQETLTEQLPAGTDFLAAVCRDWEAIPQPLADLGIRVNLARIGIVLSREGGALPRMMPPFQIGIGGALGDGQQPFPWIHLQDVARALAFLATQEHTQGPYNLTGPRIVTNREFSRLLARALGKSLFLDVPAVAVRLLFGEMAVLLLHGQNAVSDKLREAGFSFRFEEAQAALDELFS